MLDSIKNFTIDCWYKLVALVGIAVLILALTTPLQVPNGPVALIALGAFLFGLGQWINHPLQVRLVGNMKISGHLRRNHWGGVCLEILGAVLMGWGSWLLLPAL